MTIRISYALFVAVLIGVLATATVASAAVSCPTITRTLKYGSRGADVTTLQTYLASSKDFYPEAAITGFFGRATEKAVQRFQAAQNIVSSGTAASTGYGSVGAKTRAALAACNTSAANGTALNTPATVATSSAAVPPVTTTPLVPVTPIVPSAPLVTFTDGATTTVTYGVGPMPTINTFNLAPRIVDLTNDSANMYWTSSNTVTCSAEKWNGSGYTAVSENVGVNGSVNLVVAEGPTTFSLKCVGIGNNSSSSPTTIRRDVAVQIAHPKPSCTIKTDKEAYVYAKDSIIMSWTTVGADNITWVHGAGTDPVSLPYGNQYQSGSLMLSSIAGSSQTVTMNVSGYGGSATCSKTFSIVSAS